MGTLIDAAVVEKRNHWVVERGIRSVAFNCACFVFSLGVISSFH